MKTKRTSPYQGLAPFEEKDAPYFFGRDSETRLIIADMHSAPLTLLYGASGVGKSSVLRAGVLPALQKRKDVHVVVFAAWKDDPLKALKERVLATSKTQTKLDRKPLREFLLGMAKRSRRRLMIILDQFEEYSLYHPDDDDFGREFPPATSIDDFSVSFLLSLREDSVARLDRFEGRIPALFDNYRRIDHLSDSAAREAIEKPLLRYNEDNPRRKVKIEPELVKAVLSQVRSGQIEEGTGGTGIAVKSSRRAAVESPYLQLVMSRIWNYERAHDSKTLRLTSLSALGNAASIVDGHLQEVMKRLNDEQRKFAARVFNRLVTPSGTKIAFSVHDLSVLEAIDENALHTVLESLASGAERILRPIPPVEEGGSPRYEIFHDRLAPAILKWCTEFVTDQEVTKEREKELERRKQVVGAAVAEPVRVHASTSGPKPPYGLLGSLFRDQQLVVVIGSAVSASARPSGAGPWQPDSNFLPTGDELQQQLGAEAGFPKERLPFAALGEIVSYFEKEFGRFTLQKRLREIFGDTYPISDTHKLLARIALDTPQLIVTTTIDRQLESALRFEQVRFEVLVTSDKFAITPLFFYPNEGPMLQIESKGYELQEDSTCVYKMFGSIARDLPSYDTFIMSEEDELDLAAEMSKGGNVPPPAIRREFQSRHLLFIGMGLGSWPQRLFIRNLFGSMRGRMKKRAFAIVRAPSELDRRRWHQAEIEAFDIDVNQFARELASGMKISLR